MHSLHRRTIPRLPGVGRLLVLLAMVLARYCACAEWPTYMHDNRRSGVTTERLAPPLSLHWKFEPRARPCPAWPDPVRERVRVLFDQAFDVTVSGGCVYFGSSAEDKLYCLDAETGRIKWRFLTDAPVRLAPTVHEGSVYAGCDDGCAYCLDASSGRLKWRFRGGPGGRKVLGNGRLISVWPIRTSIAVEDGIAYFCAGLFPTESVFVCALDADDGSVKWRNDTYGQLYMRLPHGGTEAFSGLVPEGYLLCSPTRLYVPNGRSVPAALDRETGKFLYWRSETQKSGGTYALLTSDMLFSGPERTRAFKSDGGDYFASFPGQRLLVTENRSFLLTADDLFAVDRQRYASLLVAQENHKGRLSRAVRAVEGAARNHSQLVKKKAPEEEIRKAEAALRKWTEERKKIGEELKRTIQELNECVLWRNTCRCPDSLILAGDILCAGGDGKIVAVDAASGKTLWTGQVDGRACGLAASDGRLFASCDTGAIHCFGAVTKTEPQRRTDPAQPNPFADDGLADVCRSAADAAVARTGVKKGYCLVLGAGTGRLAYELAKRTDLMIYGVEADPERVAAARRMLDMAGLYGSRVVIHQGTLTEQEYPSYFANLVVSEGALSGKLPGDEAKEVFRLLKPNGGSLLIGQPEEAARQARLDTDRLWDWVRAMGTRDYEVTAHGGAWALVKRGALAGGGIWTHQYGDTGNTGCSDDSLVKCPLGLLWFGRPGPARMIDRHSHPPSPLSIGGRLFIPADDRVVAVDAYNGVELWDVPMPGARRVNMSRDASNMAVTADSVFRTTGDSCWRLDVATGQRLAVYKAPAAADGKPRDWGYLACVGDLLLGGTTAQGAAYTRAVGNFYSGTTQPAVSGDCMFAMGMGDGKVRWKYSAGIFPHTAVAVCGQKAFLVESRSPAVIAAGAGQRGPELLEKQYLVALDLRSGAKAWERSVDLGKFGTGLFLYGKGDVILAWGATEKCHLAGFSAADGSSLWDKEYKQTYMHGYRCFRRPVIVGDTVYAEPFAFDLATGKPFMRTDPVSGAPTPWEMRRAYGCGTVSAAPSCLFYRSGSLGIYDLQSDPGTSNWGGMRPGCWINVIAAAGLVLAPEGSAGCICSYPLQTSVALIPMERNENWSVYGAASPLLPVRHLALNIGAPGDRRDASGQLWLSYPRPPSWMAVKPDIKAEVADGLGYFRQNSDVARVTGTDKPWVITSGCLGLSRLTIPVSEEDGQASSYTVRLYFAELMPVSAGQRVFDVVLQGRKVLSGMDVVQAAGGRSKQVVREFRNVRADGSLVLQLVPKGNGSARESAALLNGVEILREGD